MTSGLSDMSSLSTTWLRNDHQHADEIKHDEKRRIGSPMVNGDGTANSAPNLDAVFSWRDAGDVDVRPAGTLHDVLHAVREAQVLHQFNDFEHYSKSPHGFKLAI